MLVDVCVCRVRFGQVRDNFHSLALLWICTFFSLYLQEADFMGWPDEEEMRAHIITPKLAKVLKKYCSKDPMVEVPITAGPPVKQTSAPVPNLTSPEATRGKNGASKSNETVSHLVTPVVTERDVSMPCSKVSDKKAMEMHKKWLKQAQAFDPNAKLILDMEKAKKLILDVLYDAFAPMNITQIHKVRGLLGRYIVGRR